MSNCYGMYYCAKQAILDGKEMTSIDKLIHKFSYLTHVEFRFSERYHGISFSSTMQGDYHGCRFLDILYSHPLRWVPQLLPMTDEQEDIAWEEAHRIEGSKYDMLAVTGVATGIGIVKPDPDKYWCNEAYGSLVKKSYGWGDEFKPDTQLPIDTFFYIHRLLGKE